MNILTNVNWDFFAFGRAKEKIRVSESRVSRDQSDLEFQVRLRAAEGMRIEITKKKTIETTNIIKNIVGPENISVTSAYVGQHISNQCFW